MKKCLMIPFMLLCFASTAFGGINLVKPNELANAAAFADNAVGCLGCHQEYKAFLTSDMPAKRKESEFIKNTFMDVDPRFGEKNCGGCHVNSCLDCHKDSAKPSTATCIRCHSDLHVGLDYTGLGIREDHERYRRGPEHNGENYMKMLPDIHFEKGMGCADCHGMKSLMNKESAKQCLDCHSYSNNVIDHEIAAHSNVVCVSCHSAWAPTEYGAFYIRFIRSDTVKSYFRHVKQLNDEYVKSSFMRLNTRFALGKDAGGRYTPIRPRLVFYTLNYENKLTGRENVMLSNRWEIFTPHTVRRETVLCGSCHTDSRRWLLETESEAYLIPRLDRLPINSFWNSEPFALPGGKFITQEEFDGLSKPSNTYAKYYLRKLGQLKKVTR